MVHRGDRSGAEVSFSAAPEFRLKQTEPAPSLPGVVSFQLGRYRGGSSVQLGSLSGSVRQHRREHVPAFNLAEARLIEPERDLRIRKIQGDGRCMFRALARGMAANQGLYLNEKEEVTDADELRLAVSDALCRTPQRRRQFQEVVDSIEHTEGGIRNYCSRLQAASFWGGEAEILVLSRMLQVPIYVYQTAEERGSADWGFHPIVKYGEQFEKPQRNKPARKPVHLLYTGGNHYDLLLR